MYQTFCKLNCHNHYHIVKGDLCDTKDLYKSRKNDTIIILTQFNETENNAEQVFQIFRQIQAAFS